MNLFTSSASLTLLMLTAPIVMSNTNLYKSDKYQHYVKNITLSAWSQ